MVNAFSPSRARELIAVYRGGLFDDVLPFWLTHAVDKKFGGILNCLDRDGSILDTDKGVWIQGRFAWLLGKLYNHPFCSDHPDRDLWRIVAEHTLRFVVDHCFDSNDSRMWFQVTRDGKPIRKRRYSYAESFASIAFGEWAKATGKNEYRELAQQCFDRFVKHNALPNSFEPKFTATRPTKSIGFPMITINVAQQLRASIALESANEWIDRSIEEIRSDFLKPDIECVMETVGPHGEILDHFEGRTLNPGHAIEAAWFIMNEGICRENGSLVKTGCQMLDWMWHRGWDDEHGGILYFSSVDSRPLQEYWHDMKFWWPQTETIIATLLAATITGDQKYVNWHTKVHDWAYAHFPDILHGEWFGYLRKDGSISSSAKGNLWKGPFHLPRMQLICWEILDGNRHASSVG